MATDVYDNHLTYQIWVEPPIKAEVPSVTAMAYGVWGSGITGGVYSTSGATIWKVSTSSNSNPYSADIRNQEMKEQEAKQKKVEDGRPDEVKSILRKMGYQVR